MSALAHVGNFGKFSLTSTRERSNHYPVAAKSATGIGVPEHEAHQRPSIDAWRFFIARIDAGACRPALWRAVRGGRKAHRSSCRHANRVPSVTPIGVGMTDFPKHEETRMSYDAQEAPASAARQIAYFFGLIADTLDWNHTAWLALQAKLQAAGKAPEALTLADVEAAISSINADLAEVRQ
jgi:hypothetical protein